MAPPILNSLYKKPRTCISLRASRNGKGPACRQSKDALIPTPLRSNNRQH
jgi:hypothetical protein